MLRGTNYLHFNETTMKEMVQFYFDNKLFNKDESAPQVSGIKWRGDTAMFEIGTSEKQS